MNKKNKRSFARIAWLCVFMILVTAVATVVFMPRMPPEYQSAAGSTAGSIIGTLLAFLGALFLWTKDQTQAKKQERELRDRNLVREVTAGIGTLISLDYPVPESDTPATRREGRLASIRMDESAAMIANADLNAECALIVNFARDEGLLDALFDNHYQRLHIARTWLRELFALNDWEHISTVRPNRYGEISAVVAEVEKHYDELSAEHEKWLEEEKAKTLKASRAQSDSQKG